MKTHLTLNHVVTAKAILEDRGWGQGSPVKNDGKCCLGGALAIAITGDAYGMYEADEDIPALLEFADLAEPVAQGAAVGRDAGVQIYYWNDEETRTVGEVLALLDEVATKLAS